MHDRRLARAVRIGVGTVCAAALLGPSGVAGQEADGGSTVPCAVPLRWRLARVDREFGIAPERVVDLVTEASSWWSSAAGTVLFEHAPDDGFPVRLVFDERQARVLERAEAQRPLEEEAHRLEAGRTEILTRERAAQDAEEAYRERAGAYERSIEEHNEEVRAWNARGGAPPEVAEALAARGRTLEEERRAVERSGRDLRRSLEDLQRDQRAFNERAAEHARRADSVARAFPPVAVQSGEYREAVRREDGRPVSVGREIRIYRFVDELDLRLVVAHELGHALGLGHVDDARAVMSEEHVRIDGGGVPSGVGDEDLRRLRRVCPGLLRGAPG